MALTANSTNKGLTSDLPYQLDLSQIKNYFSAIKAERAGYVDVINSDNGIPHNSVVIGSECLVNNSRCLIMGYQASSTADDQIVFAAGNNNQLRFNDGICTLNGEVISTSTEIEEALRDIFKKIKYFELI